MEVETPARYSPPVEVEVEELGDRHVEQKTNGTSSSPLPFACVYFIFRLPLNVDVGMDVGTVEAKWSTTARRCRRLTQESKRVR